MTTPAIAPQLKKTALNATHRALKAKMVDFGGWDMPVEYPNFTPQRQGPVAGGPVPVAASSLSILPSAPA